MQDLTHYVRVGPLTICKLVAEEVAVVVSERPKCEECREAFLNDRAKFDGLRPETIDPYRKR